MTVPSPDLHEQLEYVNSVSGADVDKLEKIDLKTQPADEIVVPLLADARLNLECELVSTVPAGDHYLFLGRIVAAHYNVDKDQLYFAGRTPEGKRIFQQVHTTFDEDLPRGV